MTQPAEALARHRPDRAHEALADGKHLLERGTPRGAVNRFYYAAFYAARALLALRGMDSARPSGVIALFQQHFVKTGPIDADVAKALPRSFERRQDSDYADFAVVTLEESGRICDEVERFVGECGRLLDRLGTQGPADLSQS